jgi:hypothetical protein
MMKTWIVALISILLIGCGGEDDTDKKGSELPVSQAPPNKAPDEKVAVQALASTNEAQSIHFKRFRRYALTFNELIDSRLLKTEPTVDETGYEFRLRPTADAQSYTISAAPTSASTSARHLFTNQTGVIRAELDKEATATSPEVAR